MSSYVPRAVPPHDDVSQINWYCLDCLEYRASEASIRTHWTSCHGEQGEDAANGVDYAVGSQLLLLRIRRDQWIAEQADAFFAEMHEGFGADDFVAEAEIRSV